MKYGYVERKSQLPAKLHALYEPLERIKSSLSEASAEAKVSVYVDLGETEWILGVEVYFLMLEQEGTDGFHLSAYLDEGCLNAHIGLNNGRFVRHLYEDQGLRESDPESIERLASDLPELEATALELISKFRLA